MRRRIESTIEQLIGLLDELDGDPDLEPALGWTHHEARRGRYARAGQLDLEEQCEDEGEDTDREGLTDDNGIADMGGLQDQVGHIYGDCL